jgi:hypothetical protein
MLFHVKIALRQSRCERPLCKSTNGLSVNNPSLHSTQLRLMLSFERFQLRLLPIEDGIHLRLMLFQYPRKVCLMLLLDRLQLSRMAPALSPAPLPLAG